MGYNLPAGTTQGVIDRYYDSPLAWVCEDPACGERWSDYPELWPCSVEGCEIAGCPTCHSVCFSCNADLCSAHWTMADVGDGIRRYCAGCLADGRDLLISENDIVSNKDFFNPTLQTTGGDRKGR